MKPPPVIDDMGIPEMVFIALGAGLIIVIVVAVIRRVFLAWLAGIITCWVCGNPAGLRPKKVSVGGQTKLVCPRCHRCMTPKRSGRG